MLYPAELWVRGGGSLVADFDGRKRCLCLSARIKPFVMTIRSFSLRSAALCTLTLLATACANQDAGRFPSLLPRPIEGRSDAEPVVAVPIAAPDPTLDALIAKTLAAVATTRREFAATAGRTDTVAKRAKGDPVGGERWIEAQTALAELDVHRATSLGLVTDLEEAALQRAADGKPPYPALDAAQTAAQTELDAESAHISRLQASLPEA
jgi:hypothetical protein